MVHLVTKNQQPSDDDPIEIEDDESPQVAKKAKLQVQQRQRTIDYFMSPNLKESIQSMVAEMAAKDGMSFRTISGSRCLQMLLKQCGYDPPASHTTVRKYVGNEAAAVRKGITEKLAKLKQQNKKFSTSIDEQTTTANFRILNIHLYSEAGSFNLGMARINISCRAPKMVEVSGICFSMVKLKKLISLQNFS